MIQKMAASLELILCVQINSQINSFPSDKSWFGPVVDETNLTDPISSEDDDNSDTNPRQIPSEIDFKSINVNQNQSSHKIKNNQERHFCECFNQTSPTHQRYEVTCKCFGQSITEIPTNFTQKVSRLSLVSLGIQVLNNKALTYYSSSLQDLSLESMEYLKRIEPGTFQHCTLLRTVYIKQAPLLTIIPDGVFWGKFPHFRILKIIHSGLEVLPTLRLFDTKGIISIVDFDSNQLKNVSTSSVNVKAETLILDYNRIEIVDKMAFSGSHIAALSLKGNRELTHIHSEAFVGLKSLTKLDLSETSITKLPTKGLQDLEIIRIEDTKTLKVFPSVFEFKKLKKAQLTYSYHCCAFQFPATHDPEAYDFQSRMDKRYCTTQKSSSIITDNHSNASDKSSNEDESTTWTTLNDEQSATTNNHWKASTTSGKVENHLNGFQSVFKKVFTFWSNIIDAPRSEYVNYPSKNCQKCLKKGELAYESDYASFANHLSSSKVYASTSFHVHNSSSTSPSPFDNIENTLNLNSIGFGRVISPSGNTKSTQKEDYEIDGKFHGTTADVDPRKTIDVKPKCGEFKIKPKEVICLPEPDAFNPCEDVMGNILLRIADWIVAVAAVLGNLAVMVVLMSGRFSMTVSKFLMCNLAFADFCMGLYLLIIAIIDARTIGAYFNHAIDWQHGLGCQVTGFITVFASELSIFTLTVITLERWYAISYAVHLNRRLQLSSAIHIMIAGWVYAILVASLPLSGVSGYSKTSICLPMENRNALDLAYLLTLLITNALAFLLISACYGKMYIAIIKQRTRAATNDMTIAKRMALLVFTDFACWAPIAFFGLTAISGYPLINVTNSKILLVFFYPLNSCANPFLYVILTKQYRRDFFILISRYGFCTERAARYKGTQASRQHPRILACQPARIIRRNALHGQQKQLYRYKSRASLQPNSCSDDNSGVSIIYSALDVFPDSSCDSSHEIVRMEYFARDDLGRWRYYRRNNYSNGLSQSSSEESSSSMSRRCQFIIQDGKKMRCLPSSEREEILKVILSDRISKDKKYSPQRNNIHKSHKNCTSWIQPEISSSGERTSSNEEDKQKSSSRNRPIIANEGCVTSSHSNSLIDDNEQF